MSQKAPRPRKVSQIDWEVWEECFPPTRWNQELMRDEETGPPPRGMIFVPGDYNPETRAEHPGCYIRRRPA